MDLLTFEVKLARASCCGHWGWEQMDEKSLSFALILCINHLLDHSAFQINKTFLKHPCELSVSFHRFSFFSFYPNLEQRVLNNFIPTKMAEQTVPSYESPPSLRDSFPWSTLAHAEGILSPLAFAHECSCSCWERQMPFP